jgi:hypothetical protein
MSLAAAREAVIASGLVGTAALKARRDAAEGRRAAAAASEGATLRLAELAVEAERRA